MNEPFNFGKESFDFILPITFFLFGRDGSSAVLHSTVISRIIPNSSDVKSLAGQQYCATLAIVDLVVLISLTDVDCSFLRMVFAKMRTDRVRSILQTLCICFSGLEVRWRARTRSAEQKGRCADSLLSCRYDIRVNLLALTHLTNIYNFY